jgi:hypothetical protein
MLRRRPAERRIAQVRRRKATLAAESQTRRRAGRRRKVMSLWNPDPTWRRCRQERQIATDPDVTSRRTPQNGHVAARARSDMRRCRQERRSLPTQMPHRADPAGRPRRHRSQIHIAGSVARTTRRRRELSPIWSGRHGVNDGKRATTAQLRMTLAETLFVLVDHGDVAPSSLTLRRWKARLGRPRQSMGPNAVLRRRPG